jgi:hypothetical protein
LFKVVEVRVGANGRLERVGSIWHDSLERARHVGSDLASNPQVLRIEIVSGDGRVIEAIGA